VFFELQERRIGIGLPISFFMATASPSDYFREKNKNIMLILKEICGAL